MKMLVAVKLNICLRETAMKYNYYSDAFATTFQFEIHVSPVFCIA